MSRLKTISEAIGRPKTPKGVYRVTVSDEKIQDFFRAMVDVCDIKPRFLNINADGDDVIITYRDVSPEFEELMKEKEFTYALR